MSSTGQIVGGVVGAVAGFFAGGNVMLGAQLGMMLGGALDPPKGKNTSGPRLNDLTVQTSTYGATIPRLYGTCAINGNIFWLKGNKIDEIPVKKKTGGKGGSKATNTTWAAYATFAVGICKGPITGVRRIWLKGELFYDAGSSDASTIAASNAAAEGFTLYLGTDTQMPDPMIVADKGAGDTPAYRGLAYIVFTNLALAKYGNSLAGVQAKVEVMRVADVHNYPCTPHSGAVPISPWEWSAPAWDGEAFCCTRTSAPGASSVCMVSPDGVTWTQKPMPTVSDTYARWYGLAASPTGVFIAGHNFNHGAIARSLDHGQTWAMVTIDNTFTVNAIGYGNGTFLAVDHYNAKAAYSTNDGVSWTIVDLPRRITGGGLTVHWCAAFGKFFVSGYNNTTGLAYVWSSSTGATWSETLVYYSLNWCWITSISSTVIINSTANGDGMLVSTDGVSWTRRAPGSSGYPWDGVHGTGTDGTAFLFLTNVGILYSYDLTTFNTVTYTTIDGVLSNVCWNGARFVSVSTTGSGDSLTILQRTVTPISESLSAIIVSECLQNFALTSGDINASALPYDVRGYVVGSLGTIKSALEPLQAGWPFDVVQRGYTVYFIPRGGSPVTTVVVEDLGARGGSTEHAVQISTGVEGDTHLPRRVTVRHLDVDREYEIGEQYAERYNTAAISENTVDLAVVLNATEAAGKAEVLLYLYWTEKFDVSVIVPATYNNLEPGDVVTLITLDGPITIRLTGVNYTSDGRVEIKAKYANSAVYTPTAIGSYSAVSGPSTIASAGKSSYVLMDVPYMHPAQADPSLLATMYGNSAWPGGVLIRTDDSGTTWNDLQGFSSPGGTVGYATNTIGVVDARVWDKASSLSVSMSNGDLSSVSELAVLNGVNRFAYGYHGRWEIIGVQNCSLVSPGTYRLYDMLRGQYGTEWAMGLHTAGDFVVLLSDSDVSAIGMSVSSIGLSREYRGITLDQTIDTDVDYPFTYSGVNLECLSPAYFTGYRQSNTDWVMTWLRRSRTDGEWRDYVDVGLGETSEAYQVDIFTDNTFSTVKRTISSSVTMCTYTSAQQVADFGAAQNYVYAKVYQVSPTVGRGYPTTTTMILEGNDPYWSSVVLLMPMTGLNGGTLFPDLKAHTPITASGNAQTSTARSPLSIGSSGLFDGTGDYITLPTSADWAFGTGDFTVEAWVFITSYSGSGYPYDQVIFGKQAVSPACLFFLQNSTGKPSFYDNTTTFVSSTAVPLNTWTFVQWVRESGVLKIGMDGVIILSTGMTTNFTASSGFYVGGQPIDRFLFGNISQLRVTKAARVFAVPTAPLPSY